MVLTTERERRGWSKGELARRAGMSPATVGQIESGRLRPYESQRQKLASALGVPPERLLDEAEPGRLEVAP